MGACASKPNVLNGEAPEVAPENVVMAEEEVKMEEGVIADDDANKIPSLSNLLKNEEGKGSAEEKEDTSVPSEAKKELEIVEKVVDDAETADATCVDEKKLEEVKSETAVEENVEEVVKPSMVSIPAENNKADHEEKAVKPSMESIPAENNKADHEEKAVKPSLESIPAENNKADHEEKAAAAEEAPAVEEVKPETETTPADEKTATEEKKIEEEKSAPEDPKSEASSVEINKTQEKPATKKGKFWWDK